MDPTNIVQPSTFIFFILIITVGYILVEVIWWEKYYFRDVLNRYAWSNIMDRIIHYVSVGVVFHFLILIFFTVLWKGEFLDEIFSSGYQFSQNLNFTDGGDHFDTRLNAQLITSSVLYFLFIMFGLFCIRFWMWFWNLLSKISGKIISKLSQNKAWKNKKRRATHKEVEASD